jgi:sporulation protein YqfC
VSDLLEVPGDLVLNVPRVTIVGNLQMVIENHRGLIEYSPEFIRVGTSTGQMTIAGTDLAVGSVFADDLSVMGRFTRITFEEMPEGEEAP